jgi:hypothetical protein
MCTAAQICRCWDVFDASSLTEILTPVADCNTSARMRRQQQFSAVSRIEMGVVISKLGYGVLGRLTTGVP